MDHLLSLESFVAVVESGGFSAASRRLRVPLATISRRVSELETMLGIRLLTRTTRRVVPTDGGRRFFETVRGLLDQLAEAERLAAGEAGEPRGELRITAPIVFGRLHVLPAVTAFLARQPAIDVQLVLLDRNVDLLEEHIDLAVRIGTLPDSSMIALPLGHIRRVVCASPAYLKSHGVPRHPRELANHDCISFVSVAGAREWPFRIGHADRLFPIRMRLSASTAEAAVDATVSGLGLTRVLAYQAAAAIRRRQLQIVLEKFEQPAAPVHFVYPAGRLVPAKLRAFLDFSAPRLRASLAAIDQSSSVDEAEQPAR